MHQDCVFCKIIAREIPATIIEETDQLIVIQDLNPKAKIHYLIIPKKHIIDIQSFEKADCCIGSKMFFMAQALSQKIAEQLGSGDFRFQINSGIKAGQRVFHLHAHILAGSIQSEF